MRGLVTAALTVAIGVAATGCSAVDGESQLAGSIADLGACPSAVRASAAVALPADLPVPAHTHAYQSSGDTTTTTWLTAVPARSVDVVAVRDGIARQLEAHGYRRLSENQEPGAEADLVFTGPELGSAQVRPLCAGHVRVRWAVGPGAL